jgi:hypothetical protein
MRGGSREEALTPAGVNPNATDTFRSVGVLGGIASAVPLRRLQDVTERAKLCEYERYDSTDVIEGI